MDYIGVASRALKDVGGKDNVKSVIHCATRLRFVLFDKSRVDRDAIQADKDFLGFVDAQGQSQIIVGSSVPAVYDALTPLLNKSDQASTEKADHSVKSEKKTGIIDRILATISAIFTPYIPVLASAGIIQGLLGITVTLGWLTEKSDTYKIFYGIGNAMIYFFPVLLAFTAAKQFKSNPYIGAVIGAALLEPNIAGFATGSKASLLGIHFTAMNFSSTVIPILLSMWVYAQLERFLRKHMAQNLQLILVPVICLVFIVPLTLLVFGPVGSAIANGIADVYKMMLHGNMVLFQVVFGGFFIFVIMFGMHWVLLPIQLSILASQGREYSLAAGGMGNYALLGVCLAVLIFSKSKEERGVAGSAAFVNALSGITEPGIYGILIRNKKYFAAVALGGMAGGLVHGLTGTYVTAFAFSGILGSPAFISSPKAVPYFIGVAVAIVVGFLATMIMMKTTKRTKRTI